VYFAVLDCMPCAIKRLANERSSLQPTNFHRGASESIVLDRLSSRLARSDTLGMTPNDRTLPKTSMPSPAA